MPQNADRGGQQEGMDRSYGDNLSGSLEFCQVGFWGGSRGISLAFTGGSGRGGHQGGERVEENRDLLVPQRTYGRGGKAFGVPKRRPELL